MNKKNIKICFLSYLFILVISMIFTTVESKSLIVDNRTNKQKKFLSEYPQNNGHLVKEKNQFVIIQNKQNKTIYPSDTNFPVMQSNFSTISLKDNSSLFSSNLTTNLNNIHISPKLVNFIVEHEGNASMLPPLEGLEDDKYGLYNDPQGNCTLGIGHFVHFDNCTSKDIELHKKKFPNGTSKIDALKILNEELISVENDVKKYVKVQLSQQQFDSLVDFTFNEGSEILKDSKLLKDINAGKFDAKTIEEDFKRHTRDGLLTERRNDEANIFNNNSYTVSLT
jgi:GH24 family phage-related lysozyme (muramidase)